MVYWFVHFLAHSKTESKWTVTNTSGGMQLCVHARVSVDMHARAHSLTHSCFRCEPGSLSSGGLTLLAAPGRPGHPELPASRGSWADDGHTPVLSLSCIKKDRTEISAVSEPSNYKIIRVGERGGIEPTTSDRGSGMQFFELLAAIITVRCP